MIVTQRDSHYSFNGGSIQVVTPNCESHYECNHCLHQGCAFNLNTGCQEQGPAAEGDVTDFDMCPRCHEFRYHCDDCVLESGCSYNAVEGHTCQYATEVKNVTQAITEAGSCPVFSGCEDFTDCWSCTSVASEYGFTCGYNGVLQTCTSAVDDMTMFTKSYQCHDCNV